MTLLLSQVRDQARRRPAGYFGEVVGSGVVVGDRLVLSDAAARRLFQKYNPNGEGGMPDSLKEPTLVGMLEDFVAATKIWAAAGFPVCTKAQIEARVGSCNNCDKWDAKARLGLGLCSACGCTLIKRWLATEKCPLGKWSV